MQVYLVLGINKRNPKIKQNFKGKSIFKSIAPTILMGKKIDEVILNIEHEDLILTEIKM